MYPILQSSNQTINNADIDDFAKQKIFEKNYKNSIEPLQNPATHQSIVVANKVFPCNLSTTQTPQPSLQNTSPSTSNQTTKYKAFPCKLCPKTYTAKNSLDNHVNIHHLGLKDQFKCDVCGKTFTRKFSLHEHYQIHEGYKNTYKCDECGKTFHKKSALTLHSQLHSKIKFTCEICSRPYSQKSRYIAHLNFHKDKEQFKCELCWKFFTSKYYLKYHLEQHKIIEKPKFTCPVCNKTYSAKSTLTTHVKAFHTDEEFD